MPGFTLLVARDEAEYLWGALLQLGRGHGLVPVGALAVEDGPS
jgi:glycine cleavage system aminomethyltransferase T